MKNLLHFEFLTNSKMCISIFHAESINKTIQMQKSFQTHRQKQDRYALRKGSSDSFQQYWSKWVFRVRKIQKKVSEENFLIVGSEQKVDWLSEYQSNGDFFRQCPIPNESRYYVSLPLTVKSKE